MHPAQRRPGGERCNHFNRFDAECASGKTGRVASGDQQTTYARLCDYVPSNPAESAPEPIGWKGDAPIHLRTTRVSYDMPPGAELHRDVRYGQLAGFSVRERRRVERNFDKTFAQRPRDLIRRDRRTASR